MSHSDLSATAFLSELKREAKASFSEQKQVLSFSDYLDLVAKVPRLQLRSTVQYLLDCIAYYGVDEQTGRYRVFDSPWNEGRDKVVGQEQAQHRLVHYLKNFDKEQRISRLIMLHGPNGSAKSSLIRCLGEALADYSYREEGAIYRFNWIFPKEKVEKKGLGFSSTDLPNDESSFAYLDEEMVAVKLPADLKDHPLLLIEQTQRAEFITSLLNNDESSSFRLADIFLHGDLAPRSKEIFDALFASYQGDLQRVFQHIQVQRFHYSSRYRRGIVTVEPQLHVDASIRQISMDQRLQALPPVLRNLNLFEPMGDLIEANRGIIEFNDLLKKPVDAFKYLLATCEKGTVALPNAILHLDVLFLASSNEQHLAAFKAYPDFASFKGRMDLVRMPYLLDYQVEKTIYDHVIEQSKIADQVVPHATETLALWAVLTRLLPPDPRVAPENLKKCIGTLSPLEKAELYAGHDIDKELDNQTRRELKNYLVQLKRLGAMANPYEGQIGASPREMKEVLFSALQDSQFFGMSPLGILAQIEELIADPSVYNYLQRAQERGYFDHASFVDIAKSRYFDILDDELHWATGLVNENQYLELFSKYIKHISYFLKKEQIYDELTGKRTDPDAKLMRQLESVWHIVESSQMSFRQDLIGRIGAWKIDKENSEREIDYQKLFPKLLDALEDDYYEKQKKVVKKNAESLLSWLRNELHNKNHHRLDEEQKQEARHMMNKLTEIGYTKQSAIEAFSALFKARY